jgi:hypothetical protein
MGYLGYVYVESKSFEFRSAVRGGVRLEERSKGVSRSVIMAWPTIFWLIAAWDSLTPSNKDREKWRSFRFGNIVYVVLRRKNKFGNFMEISEYGEKGRRSFVIIPEGEEGKGWNDCRMQFSKLKQHHDKQKQGGTFQGGQPGGTSAGSLVQTKGQQIVTTDSVSLQGDLVKKSYAEAVQGKIQNLNLLPQLLAGKDKTGEPVTEQLRDIGVRRTAEINNSLSVDVESVEKGEQVSILTIRDMLSEFKKDIISCLESYLVGWASSNADVNQATKGDLKLKSKLGFEKPKPHIKHTYFRKKSARPTTRWQKKQRDHGHRFGTVQPIEVSSSAELQTRRLEKGESSRAGLKKVSPVSVLDTPATGDSDTPAAGDNISFGLSSSDRPLHDRSLLAIASGSVSVCSDAIPELPASGSSSPAKSLHDRSFPAVATGSASLANGSNCSEHCSDVPAPSLLSSPDMDAAPVICQDHTSGFSSPARSLHDRSIPAVAAGPVSLANGSNFSECCSEVPASSLLSPVICHDRTIVQVSVPGFSFSSVCPPVLSEAPVCGHELQIMPGCDLGQLWEAPVRATPIPGASVIPPFNQVNSSNFSGGPVLSGMDSATGFTGFGGGEPLCVLRSESFGKEEGQCSDLIVSHDGEEEGQLAVEPLNVQFPFTVNESEFPDWVVKVAERIHSKVGVTYVGQKWEFMGLLTFLEKERFKELEAQSLSANRMNREVKNLECSINYDNRGDGQSSRGKRKGRGSNVVS